MDNNSNFEQQFTQNLKASAPVAQPVDTSTGNSKLPLIIAIVLAVVTLVESIILIITLTNYFSFFNTTGEEEEQDYEEVAVDEEAYNDSDFHYDSDFNLTAFNVTCTSDDGSSYTFDLTNNYSYSGSTPTSGTYSIKDSDLISLSNSDKVLYYNGINVADGLNIYSCTEDTESEDAE